MKTLLDGCHLYHAYEPLDQFTFLFQRDAAQSRDITNVSRQSFVRTGRLDVKRIPILIGTIQFLNNHTAMMKMLSSK